MAQNPQVFPGITPDQYARLTEKARAAGIDLSGNTGSATKFGVEVAWNYQPEAQQLTLEVRKTPFFISVDDVQARLRNLVAESLA